MPPEDHADDELIATAQAAKRMRVKPATIRSWVRKGYLTAAGRTERGWSVYWDADVRRAEQKARKAALRTSGHDVRTTRRVIDCAA
jgi:DNA-binding transcriptional MerR regulator